MSAATIEQPVERRYDVEWPSVTEVLSLSGLVNDRWFTEHAAWRGTVVHKFCEYDDYDDLDDSSVDESHLGYLEAWRKFKRETGYQPVSTEQIVRKDDLQIIGRLDSLGRMYGCDAALVDRKTGHVTRVTALQTAAYAACLEKPYLYRRFAVELKPDGNYSMLEFLRANYRRDLYRWTCARVMAQLREEWKL